MKPTDLLVLLIDVQDRLHPHMENASGLTERLLQWIHVSTLLSIPVLSTEQVPEKLGETIPAIREHLPGAPFPKSEFSAWRAPDIRKAIVESGKRNIVLTGIEAHICVFQTACDLLRHGYRVFCAADAVASRSELDKTVALEQLRQRGARIWTTEMLIFDWLETADAPKFKPVVSVMKST